MKELRLVKEKKMEAEEVKRTYRQYQIGAYEVDVVDYNFEDKANDYRSISVQKDFYADFLPEIFFYGIHFGEVKNEFKIQTTSYGAMDPEGIKKVIAGYEEAMQIVEVLTEAFCK